MGITWGSALRAVVLPAALVVAVVGAKRLGDGLVGAVGRRGLLLLPLLLVANVAHHLGELFGGTSPKKVRKLAGSAEAVRGREQAEARIRRIIAAWDEHTPLTLGMIAINDRCIGGKPPEWFFSSGDSRCKVRCALYVTAYFGADPNQVADTIDGILAAGDEQAAVPFGHDFAYANRVVDYYRGVGGEPRGPGTGEPPGLSHAPTLTLHWDHVRTSAGPRPGLVEEPSLPEEHDPPVWRCLQEPASASIADLRGRHGMVFALEFPAQNYYTKWK